MLSQLTSRTPLFTYKAARNGHASSSGFRADGIPGKASRPAVLNPPSGVNFATRLPLVVTTSYASSLGSLKLLKLSSPSYPRSEQLGRMAAALTRLEVCFESF